MLSLVVALLYCPNDGADYYWQLSANAMSSGTRFFPVNLYPGIADRTSILM